jgi:2-oxoglutarate dehydrogenase complex dehydrogenase (E1) component-like enzyme
MCSMKDPQALFDTLTKDPYNYKLSGVGNSKYHLGGDFSRDDDGLYLGI